MAGSTGTHSPANSLDPPGEFAKHFHQTVARLAVDFVLFAKSIGDFYSDHKPGALYPPCLGPDKKAHGITGPVPVPVLDELRMNLDAGEATLLL